MSERNSAGRPVWSFPDTWAIKSKKGYWGRTVAPLLESEYKGFGLKIATQRYINPNEINVMRTGADGNNDDAEELFQVDNPPLPKTASLYPAGNRLGKGEATKALYNSHKMNMGQVYDGASTHTPVVSVGRLV